MFGDIFGCHKGGATGMEWERPGMLPNILQCTGQPPTTKTYLAQNVNSAEVEKPCSREWGSKMVRMNRERKIKKL